MTKIHLLGHTLNELQDIAVDCGLPKFAGKQIADWVYVKKVSSVEEMTNISLANREKLSEKYEVGRSAPIDSQTSADGTVKYLFRTAEGKLIESVMIPDGERATLCISSQVGCKFDCSFCMTGKQGFKGDLPTSEILNQLYSVAESNELTNAVFMGMGEPLDNYIEVRKALEIMVADYAMAWSPRRITVSTTGIIPKLKLFLEECDAQLAISIHSAIKEQRMSIMPVEKAYPIAEVVKLLKNYDWSKQRRLSFEYIMFEGFNDSLTHAQQLANLIGGMACRVNLIRFHEIPNVELKSSSQKTMEAFRDYLGTRRIPCTIRTSRGEDIAAACGMLSTEKGEGRMRILLFTLSIIFIFFACDGKNVQVGGKTENVLPDSIDGIYIPKDIEDCFAELDKLLDDRQKLRIKSDVRTDVSDFYEGLICHVRDWILPNERSRLSSYFVEKGCRYPNDIPEIILLGYHRHLNGLEVKVEEQIEYFDVSHAPSEKDFPDEGKHIDLFGSVGKGVDSTDFPIVFHHGKDSVTKQFWEYERRIGWVKLSDEEYDLKYGRFFVPPIIEEGLE